MKLPSITALLLSFAIPCVAGENASITRMRPMLGTYAEITLEGLDRNRALDAIESAFEAIAEVDRLLSSHREDSELHAINSAAGESMVTVSPWTYECIAQAVQVGRESDGAFDITCRPLLDLWGFVRKQSHLLPTQTKINSLLPLVGFFHIQMLHHPAGSKSVRNGTRSPGEYRVGLTRHGMKMDVGGIGKGFAVDKAVESLQQAGALAGLVRLGGDLRGFGDRKWHVGISDPSFPSRTSLEFEIQEEAVSTSGDYQNFFEVEGRRYSHILNPRTGWPVRKLHSCSVRAPTGARADAWSTALFVNPALKPPPSLRIVDQR